MTNFVVIIVFNGLMDNQVRIPLYKREWVIVRGLVTHCSLVMAYGVRDLA